MHIVDRRLNPAGKSFANRQRFIRRAKAAIREAVRKHSAGRGIRDMDGGGEVSIPVDSVREPRLARSGAGQRSSVLPGNKRYVAGDTIEKEKAGGGGGRGQDGAEHGDGEDEFRFSLSQDEYLDLFFDDLELPNLAKRVLGKTETRSPQRAGYAVSGSPTSLALGRTMRNSLARRSALRRPSQGEIARLRDALEALRQAGDPEAEEPALAARLAELEAKSRRVPYIDPIDLRYRRFQAVPKPVSQAVMVCLMDTSASMTEHMKDLAKRFFALLYLFLKRRYRHVDVVFVRHTHLAEEVDEDTFFHSRDTGGTVVSTALDAMAGIVRARYRPDEWNIYGAQASDGDNSSGDSAKTAALLEEAILPVCQYFAYLEVGRDTGAGPVGFLPHVTDLWRTYERTGLVGERFAMARVTSRQDIYPVFRTLFERRATGGARPAP